jgi:hypothetical protein
LDNDCVVRHTSGEALDRLGWKPETNGQRAAYLIAVQDWKSLVDERFYCWLPPFNQRLPVLNSYQVCSSLPISFWFPS